MEIVLRSFRSDICTGDRSDTPQGSRFRNQRACDDPHEKHWKNNHSVSNHEDWGSVAGQFPTIAPISENVTMKNAIFNTLTERAATNAGTWIDKTEHFMAKFEGIVPAAKLQANMAIASLDDITSDVFSFADMEILDANLAMIPRRLPHMDCSQAARARTCCLRFTITASPRLIVPGVMDFDAATFLHPSSHAKRSLSCRTFETLA
jgi:hypothetical protein